MLHFSLESAFQLALKRYAQDVAQQSASKQSEPNIVAGALMSFLSAAPLGYQCRPFSQKGQSGIDILAKGVALHA